MLHVASVCIPCYMLLRVVGSCCCTKFKQRSSFKRRANGRNNSQHYWANNVWSCRVRFFVALAIVLCCGYFSVQSFVLDHYHLMLVRSYRTDMHDSQSEFCQDDVPLKRKCLCYNSCRRSVPCRFGKSLLKSQNV